MTPVHHHVVRTPAQLIGDRSEALVEDYLRAIGWLVLGRQVRVGRLELDLVAVDPGPPARLVAVEVRWRARRDHGLPDESLGPAKRARLRTAIGTLAWQGRLPDGRPLPALPVAIDLVAVEPAQGPGEEARLRHHRDVLA
jgi:putative endonuclease